MPNIQANLQGFQQIASDTTLATQDLRFSAGSQTIESRGKFMSLLVRIFMPQQARREHQAVAEAFLTAVKNAIHSTSASGLQGAKQIPSSDKDAILAQMRESLSRQLNGNARLTGADVAKTLATLNDKVLIDGHAAKIQEARKMVDNILQSLGQLRPVLDHQDHRTPLSEENADLLKNLRIQSHQLKNLYIDIDEQHDDVRFRLDDLYRASSGDEQAKIKSSEARIDAGMQSLSKSYENIHPSMLGSAKGAAHAIDMALRKHDAALNFSANS